MPGSVRLTAGRSQTSGQFLAATAEPHIDKFKIRETIFLNFANSSEVHVLKKSSGLVWNTSIFIKENANFELRKRELSITILSGRGLRLSSCFGGRAYNLMEIISDYARVGSLAAWLKSGPLIDCRGEARRIRSSCSSRNHRVRYRVRRSGCTPDSRPASLN